MPAWASSGTYLDGSGAGANIPAPAGVGADDIVIAVLYVDGATDQNVTAPAEWFAAEGSPVEQGNPVFDPANARLYVYWHRAAGAESGPYAFTWDSSVYRECQAHRYEDVAPTGTPFDSPTDTAEDASNGSTTPAVDVTTAGADRLLVHAVTCWAGGTWTAGTGFTKRMQGGFGLASCFDKTQAAAGASGPVTATVTGSNRRTAWLGALKPAPLAQSTSAQVPAAATSAGVSLASRTAGYLLVSTISLDKDAGSLPTASAGWILVTSGYRPASTQVTGAAAYRIADGTSADTCTWSWTTALASPGTVALAEFRLTNAVLINGAQSANSTTAVLATSADAGAATAAGIAVAGWGQDSVQTVTTVSWSNGYTHILTDTSGTNAGRAPVSMAYKALANGDTTNTTATTTGTADQTFVIIGRFTGDDPGAGPTYATISRWLGGAAPTAMALTTFTAASVAVIPRWSINADMTGATTGATVTATSEGWAKHSITGLTANTTYYYVVSVDGVDSNARTFKTFPASGTAASFSFSLSCCLQETSNANPQSLLRMQDRNPSFWVCHGDLNYFDTDTTVVATYRGMHQETIGRVNFEALASRIPLLYTWSDHDTCGDSTYSGNVGISAVGTAYRDVVPSYTVPATGIYHTFTVGRVRFIVWDGRTFRSIKTATDDASKTLLGATQKQWTKDTITGSTEPLIFIVSEVVWAGGGVQDDHWGSYLTEQAELVSWLNANAASRKVVFLTGDAHMVAIDAGTNGGGYVSWNAGPIAQIPSEKGGPWSVGRSTAYSQMYGHVVVTDSGSIISATFTGYRADTEAVVVDTTTAASLTHTVVSAATAAGAAAAPPAALSGSGSAVASGGGAAAASPVTVGGAGSVAVSGEGSTVAPAVALMGSGSIEATGNGSTAAGPPVVAGVASVAVGGDGAIVAPAVIITGVAAAAGNYAWPPTAGAISVRKVATAEVSVR